MNQEHITDRAHGIDVHSGQYREDFYKQLLVPNFNALTGQVDFVIIKRSEGFWVDPRFREVWDILASPCPIKGIYHYQRSGVSWKRQADNVLENKPKDCQFIALDVEKTNNVLDKTFFADSSRILRYWKDNSDVKIVYYLNEDVGKTMLRIMQQNYPADKWYLEFRMWFAQYAFFTRDRKPENNPRIPVGLPGDWLIYQYDENGDSQPLKRYGSPDLNVFNGTVKDMKTWIGLDKIEPPVPPVEPPSSTSDRPKLTHIIGYFNDTSHKILWEDKDE